MLPIFWYGSSAAVLVNCALAQTYAVPSSKPSGAGRVDPALLSISLEFFAFPGYTQVTSTNVCMNQIKTLRGHAPAVRIGGTTQ
jgi:hypothetical protein